MKPKLRFNSWFARKIEYNIVLWPFIFFTDYQRDVHVSIIKHEMVHWAQIQEHGVLGFYCRYLWDWAKLYWKYRDREKAYYGIPFEIEAYAAMYADLTKEEHSWLTEAWRTQKRKTK